MLLSYCSIITALRDSPHIMTTAIETPEVIKVTRTRDTRDIGVHYVQMTSTIIARILKRIYDKDGTKASIRGWEKLVSQNDLEYRARKELLDFLPCCRCRKPIKEGEICISKRKGGPLRAYYHPECARIIHIITK